LRKRTSVEGWVVVVTGASSGNGKAIALALASRGARVVLAARRARLLQAVAREAEDLGGEALVVPCDVTAPEQVQNVAREAVERWGRIDAWVNCAGVIVWSLFEDTEIEEFRRTLDVNLMGSVYGAQAALPVMRRQGSGVIVNIASIAALVAFPTQTAYAASKAGLLIFGEALRRELRGSGVRICQVLPTGVNTSGFLHTRTRGFRFPRRITWLLQDPENVAGAALRCLEQPWVRNIPLGLQGKTTLLVGALAPRLIDVVSGFVVRLVERGGRVESPIDNLFEAPFRGHDLRGAGRRSDDDPTPHLAD
jgi:NAD(P)-dependent dehydrogenase (short-subunit alcohol dehydrogenase family)